DDLLARLVQLVEDVEEHFLCLLAAGEELYVVEDQQVDLQVIILELLDLVILEGVEELAGEVVLVDVENNFIRKIFLDIVSYRLNKVSFSNTDSTVEHEGVERRNSGLLCDSETCGTREPVAIAFNKILETVCRIES